MAIDKKEAFKAKFLTEKKLRKRFDERLKRTKDELSAVESKLGSLPNNSNERIRLNGELTELRNRVDQKEQLGVGSPGQAWLELRDLEIEAAKQRIDWELAATAESERFKRVNTTLDQILSDFSEVRTARRLVTNDLEAAKLSDRSNTLREQVDTAATLGRSDPQVAYQTLFKLKGEVAQLKTDAVNAQNIPPEPTSQRAASSKSLGAVTGVPIFGKVLGGDVRDAQGRTAKEHAQALLESFDDFYAVDPTTSPDAAKRNTAMRITAVVTATARALAAQRNDPRLMPLIAKKLMQEYQSELVAGLKPNSKDEEEAKQSVLLAEALVSDDPLTKLMTGKITGPDAVERIRNMAAKAGVKPSAMMEMLREQLEMMVGSYTVGEISGGEKENDMGMAFVLNDLYGELSMPQVKQMANMEQHVTSNPTAGLATQDRDTQVARTDEGGVDFKPTKSQMRTTVAGDTLTSLAADIGCTPDALRKANRGLLAGKQNDDDLGKGLVLQVPGTISLLDQLAPYVAAWDDDATGTTKPTATTTKGTTDEQPTPTPDAPGFHRVVEGDTLAALAKLYLKDEKLAQKFVDANPKLLSDVNATPKVDDLLRIPRSVPLPDLKTGAENLTSPTDDPNYIQAPGLPQGHQVRGPLEDDYTNKRAAGKYEHTVGRGDTFTRLANRHYADESRAGEILAANAGLPELKDWTDLKKRLPEGLKLRIPLEDKAHASLNDRQYAHLRNLALADEQDRENFENETGKSLDDWVKEKLAERYNVPLNRAVELLDTVLNWMHKVPLTITFKAENLFSSDKDEPTHGPVYSSEVVYSRGKEDLKDVIDRDTGKAPTQLGVTGGKDTGWKKDRGDNYMRWRTEKDEREGRLDQLPYEDQQIFGAANPNFEELKGGGTGNATGGDYGGNYYGDAHFLLRNEVRNRVAFAVRGGGISVGGGKSAVQRKDFTMLVYDMLNGGSGNQKYLDTLMLHAEKKDAIALTGFDWEVHLYGGFDLRKDAEAIYLKPDLDPLVAGRVQRFCKNNKVRYEDYGARPDGLTVLNNVVPDQLELA